MEGVFKGILESVSIGCGLRLRVLGYLPKSSAVEGGGGGTAVSAVPSTPRHPPCGCCGIVIVVGL